jgi:hypothetical protein
VIDCFIRITKGELADPLRAAFFDATIARWKMEPSVVVRAIQDRPIREGRLWAEEAASSEIYIYTDSDVLPHGKDWLCRGLKAMQANPEYAILSSLSLIESENRAVGPENSVVYDVAWVGAPMWVKKGILSDDLPPMTLGSECGIIDTYVKAKGYKCGLINGLRHLNMGHGFSTDPAQRWGYD